FFSIFRLLTPQAGDSCPGVRNWARLLPAHAPGGGFTPRRRPG
ncbi:hypothetical protein A2U01_0105508, partial [Trifolium medium]|nr:hypothetical protein [Trifolium medium]